MSAAAPLHTPLVSVIIPCYNHGCFLREAVDSIWQQVYPATEVIVVDDGSTDNTKEVAGECQGIKYVYQPNQGLSAARNTGIKHSKGEFLVFLDADDWLLPGAIRTNLYTLLHDDNLAFVSGGHDKVYVEEGITKEDVTPVESDHYERLLQGNYIGMHATVMYRRSIFEEIQYDTSLKRCEDYDLYLKIARKYAVHHHTEKIAAYRIHTSNMSANIPAMLTTVLEVLNRQQAYLQTPSKKQAYNKGLKVWKAYYCQAIFQNLLNKRSSISKEDLLTLLKHQPLLLFKHLFMRHSTTLKNIVKSYAPGFSLNWLHQSGLYKNYVPAIGKISLGLLDRSKPFSSEFGYDRGGPVDRYYIENFLTRESIHIKGRVLEIGDNEYTLKFGGDRVTQSDILHVNASNPNATFIGDISDAPHIPDNLFDCIILTQTLHLIYDFKGALRTCYRLLKPGGILLLTVPGITPIDHGEWKETWYWSFTDKAMSRLMGECFPSSDTEVNSFGNVLVASAFLYGMGLPEVPKSKLDYHDPHYQVIVTVKVQKKSLPI